MYMKTKLYYEAHLQAELVCTLGEVADEPLFIKLYTTYVICLPVSSYVASGKNGMF